MAVTSIPEARPRLSLRGRLFGRPVRLTFLLLLLVAALAVLAAVAFDRAYQGRVLPGVSVAGVDVSGLSAAELRAQVERIQVIPASIEAVSGGRRVTVSGSALGGRVDVDAAVAEALATGRNVGALGDVPERFGLWRDGRDIPLGVTLDRPALQAWVTARAAQLRVAPRNALIVRAGAGWVATTPRIGKSLNVTAAAAALEAALLSGDGTARRVELPIRTITPDVDRLDAVLAISAAQRMSQPLGIRFRDGRTWTIPTATLNGAITFIGGGERPTPVVDADVVAAAVIPLDKEVSRPALEPTLLKTKSGSLFGFLPGRGGRSVDVGATVSQIGALLDGRHDGSVPSTTTAYLTTTDRPPKLSEEQLEQSAPEMTLVGAWTTKFVPSERNHNGANIRLPARFINGTVVKPGSVFDFWQSVGPVTFGRGFGMGGIIEGGRTNPTGAIGGGICSASTTLFNAAARAGYAILERDNHAYYINRYPLGLDATVSKYGGRVAQNMRFRNDTSQALFIRGLSGGNWVRFEIYSLPNGRSVTFSRPSVSNVRPAIDTTVKTTALKKGQTERTESPTDGKDVVVVRTVRDASGRIIHTDRWASHYIRVDGVLRIGIG